ncbi:MAG TPA: hypothetical protein VGZ32_00715 [Actinocrinis sp.]|jgi:hypothetical protein|uniref:hypothetical protein n=1 Tax=Actinocrinis sp. TaxID=1920516 RepID=UPI002DDCF943|nr:hypothetical protein [Actinocrinis sp.]HEV3168823.1 hypothetical protein [Actinocrinis sp.]
MTIVMSEQVDAEPCDVLRGGDGPVYFLLGGQLYVVHEVLGRWIEAEQAATSRAAPESALFEREDAGNGGFEHSGTEHGTLEHTTLERDVFEHSGFEHGGIEHSSDRVVTPRPGALEPRLVEHWLVTASVGRFGRPAVFRLERRPAPPAKGPDTWTVRAERR